MSNSDSLEDWPHAPPGESALTYEYLEDGTDDGRPVARVTLSVTLAAGEYGVLLLRDDKYERLGGPAGDIGSADDALDADMSAMSLSATKLSEPSAVIGCWRRYEFEPSVLLP